MQDHVLMAKTIRIRRSCTFQLSMVFPPYMAFLSYQLPKALDITPLLHPIRLAILTLRCSHGSYGIDCISAKDIKDGNVGEQLL